MRSDAGRQKKMERLRARRKGRGEKACEREREMTTDERAGRESMETTV